ncbi:MAG TPA: hypothetical protein VE715_08520 [Blastocatellia bacterium]|nr:hypothetical protein [Blastocatellia bacterium]
MRIGLMLILLFAAHNCWVDAARPQSSDLVGRWKIDITFQNKSKRSLRFDAEDSGKGSLLLEARSNWDEPAKPSQAKWMVGAGKRVTILGPVEFPIGNVGREPGILVFKGAFKSESIITGDIEFFPMDQDPMDPKATPSKTGKFEATRVRAN